ncbi:MAG: hypothetical protein J1F14_06015 [Treponema sp.]|nr:hypothetical protein [Treponema sp.]
MLELTVNSKSPAAITAAFKKIKEMTSTGAVPKTETVHIILEAGQYRELVRFNMSSPLVMETAPGVNPEDCVIIADNCESYNSGADNRSVCVFGPNCTSVTLRGFSVINGHKKNIHDGNTSPDSAEAFFWNNTSGTLFADNMRFEGRQNTLNLKGFTYFKNCYVTGDVDFIYGDVDTALFEDSSIYLREDNRGDFNGYAVKSLALANRPGFLFSNCTFTGDKRKKSEIYVARTLGRGSVLMPKFWDSIALINCTVGEEFNRELVWDDDMMLNIYPRGNAKTGIREYRTLSLMHDGTTEDADTTYRNVKSYNMTEDDFYKHYVSRFLMLKDTPLARFAE